MIIRAQGLCKSSQVSSIFVSETSFVSYSHGYLFPSEAARVKKAMQTELERSMRASVSGSTPTPSLIASSTPTVWGHSSVSTFGVRYSPPLPDLSTSHSIEALVEGSDMSLLREGSALFPRTSYHALTVPQGAL